MPITFTDPDKETQELVDGVIADHFGELDRLAVPPKLEVRFARSAVDEENGGPVLKRFGVPCHAKIEVVKGEERSKGGPDLRLKIDYYLFCESSEETR